MDEAVITDLKHFITSTVSQRLEEGLAEVKEDIRGIRKDIKRLDTKIDDLSTAVAQAFEHTNDLVQQQFEDHELRIICLEQA